MVILITSKYLKTYGLRELSLQSQNRNYSFDMFGTDPTDNRMFWRLIIIPLLMANLLYACTAHYTKTVKTKGIYYRVKSGDTLWSIANAYKMDIQELAEANNITDPKLIGADTVLFIPDADQIIDDVMSAVARRNLQRK